MLAELDNLSGEITHWLQRARAYVDFQNSEIAKYNKTQPKESWLDELNIGERAKGRLQAYEALENASMELLDRSVLYDGYNLLHKIGEAIRFTQEPIKYSITLTSSGDWTGEIGEVITWTVDASEFQELTTTSRTRILMLDTSSLQTLLGDSKTAVKNEWSQSKIDAFNNFHKWAISRKGELNRGNTLEAFLRLNEDQWSQSGQQSWVNALNDTLSNVTPFYAGGDIDNIQIKGMNASVARLGTMINALSRTHKNIKILSRQLARLRDKPPKTESANTRVNNAIQNSIKRLLAQYGFK